MNKFGKSRIKVLGMIDVAAGILLAVAALYGLARFGVGWIFPVAALCFTGAVLLWAVVS